MQSCELGWGLRFGWKILFRPPQREYSGWEDPLAACWTHCRGPLRPKPCKNGPCHIWSQSHQQCSLPNAQINELLNTWIWKSFVAEVQIQTQFWGFPWIAWHIGLGVRRGPLQRQLEHSWWWMDGLVGFHQELGVRVRIRFFWTYIFEPLIPLTSCFAGSRSTVQFLFAETAGANIVFTWGSGAQGQAVLNESSHCYGGSLIEGEAESHCIPPWVGWDGPETTAAEGSSENQCHNACDGTLSILVSMHFLTVAPHLALLLTYRFKKIQDWMTTLATSSLG